MKPFDLDAFTGGAVAVTRGGQDAYFIAVYPEIIKHQRLVFGYGVGNVGTKGLDGLGCNGYDCHTDLVGMKPAKKTYWVNVMLSDTGAIAFDHLPHKTKEEALNDHPRWWGKLIGTYPIEIEE